LDRITDQVSFDGIRTHFTYSTNGGNNVVTTQNVALGLATVTEKDPYGQVVLVQAPNGDKTTYTYDGFGNKVTTTIQSSVDPNISQTRTYTYDDLGRLTQKSDPETKYQTFLNFNALNLPQTWTEGASVVDWQAPRPRVHYRTFDGLGRLRLETTGVTGETMAFQYTGAFLTGTNRTWGDQDYMSKSFEYLGPGARISKETTNGNVAGAW
jgi:YD repeat-containing protein